MNVTIEQVKDKVIIVTDGATDIGKFTSFLLAEHGAKVAVTGINKAKGKEVEKQINNNGGIAKFWQLNPSQENEVKITFQKIHKKFGKIDVLINNAGLFDVNIPSCDISQKEYYHPMNDNRQAIFLCTKYVIPYMKKNGAGSIINLSPIYDIINTLTLPFQHTSKDIVSDISRMDAHLYTKDKIRVNLIRLGYTLTLLAENLVKQELNKFYLFKEKHIAVFEDIAYGILYFASDKFKFVTGSELIIDAGYIPNRAI